MAGWLAIYIYIKFVYLLQINSHLNARRLSNGQMLVWLQVKYSRKDVKTFTSCGATHFLLWFHFLTYKHADTDTGIAQSLCSW